MVLEFTSLVGVNDLIEKLKVGTTTFIRTVG
jgi:hypothetical protein